MASSSDARATELATPVDLAPYRTIGEDDLAGRFDGAYRDGLHRLPRGRSLFRGMPFDLARWVLLDRPLTIDLGGAGPATHLVIAHFCDSWRGPDGRPADLPVGWVVPVGQPLAKYTVETATGSSFGGPIRRRFEVNEGFVGWGQSAFAARPHLLDRPLDWLDPLPAHEPVSYVPPGHAGLLAVLPGAWGPAQTGVADTIPSPTGDILLWLYEIEIPSGPVDLARLRMEPLASVDQGGGIVVAAVTVVRATASPLRLEPRRTLRIARTAALSEPDGGRPISVGVDLGLVIRRRSAPAAPGLPNAAPPAVSSTAVTGWGANRGERQSPALLVDVAMAPDATISVDDELVPALDLPPDGVLRRYGAVTIEPLPLATSRVEVELVDAATGQLIPGRVHFRAADGRYLAPLGHRDEVNPGLNEDTGADVILGDTVYAYVSGRFPIELPVGTVHVEAARGFGYRPLRTMIDVDGHTPIVLALEPVPGPAGNGWIAADAHVHFISPTSALLQAQAEGVEIVNLLATQWGDHHTGVTDLPVAVVKDPLGRHMVVMGSENRQNMLGHIGLLGASQAVLPMASGGSPEGRLGDSLDWLLADWADAARAQGGLAVAAHFPLPYAEVAADIVAGRIEAIELQALTPGLDGPSIREWYRFLNCGFRLPVLGGTDKMTAEVPLGAIRTYARLDADRPVSFEAWADAVRHGRTFVSSGPFVELSVDGHEPGDVVLLPPAGGTVDVRAVASAALPVIAGLELIHDGVPIASTSASGGSAHLALAERVSIRRGGWLAARVTSDHVIRSAFATAMGAHSSPVYLEVPGRPAFDAEAAAVIGTIIDGARAWVRSIATIGPGVDRARLDGYFAAARARLEERIRERSGPS